MTTYAGFISTLHGISITGVVRKFDHEPLAIHTADLPAQFIRLPGGGRNMETATTCSGDGKTRQVELVIALEPVAQDNQSPNYDAVVAMMDNAETALDAIYTSSLYVYTIASGVVPIGGIPHWAITISNELTE